MASSKRRLITLVTISTLLVSAVTAGVLLTVFSANAEKTVLRTQPGRPEEKPATSTSYTVTMSPVGTVQFEHPPQRIVTQDANYNDMLVAVGRGEQLIATGSSNNFYDAFYAQLPGTKPGIELKTLQFLSGEGGLGFDKELLYQFHADIHHIDPVQLASMRGWSKADIAEITKNIGPFFANRYSRDGIYTGKEPYEFYDLWTLTDKVAQAYRQSERIAGLKRISDDLVQRIQAKLPPREKRPRVGLIYYNTNRFTTYSLLHVGFGQAQYTAVGAVDAFEGRNISTYGDAGGQGTALDLEGLVSINPDVLIMPFAIYGKPGSGHGARSAFEQLLKLKNDPLGQRLAAFQRDQVFPGGTPLQGPVFFIFQIEMAAKQIYPDLFGRFREDQAYPPEECLFEREAVARILRGEADHGDK